MTPDQARARYEPLLLSGTRHRDYDRTAAHARQCRAFATGQTEGMLQQFSRETDGEFAVRRQLSVSMSPAIWEELRKPFYQTARLKGAQVTREITYAPGLSDGERVRRTTALLSALNTCYQQQPLEDYLAERVARTVALTDPNAWLAWDFAPFDYRTEGPAPYPVLYPCESVVDFTRTAGRVESVLLRTSGDGLPQEYPRCLLLLDNVTLDYWPVITQDGVTVATLPEGSTVFADVRDPATGAVRYQSRLLTHNAGRVPAMPIGYVPDELTEGRTFVSPLAPALPFLLAELKTGSELQIVMAQVVHPHKVQFVNRCEGLPGDVCNNGLNKQLQPCGACGGTTVSVVSTSALDTLTVPLPKDMADLKVKPAEMVAFTAPPIQVPEFQMKYQQHLTDRAKQVLFGSDLLSKTTVAATATERDAQYKQLAAALMPFAELISSLYQHGGLVSAGYIGVAQDLQAVRYDFPPDLQLITVAELEERYAGAQKAGLDAAYLELCYKELLRRKLADDPVTLRQMETKWRFLPYVGCSDEYVLKLAALGYLTPEKRVLRLEQDSIFYELQRDNPGFYELTTARQQELVDAKVAQLLGIAAGAGVGAGVVAPLRMSFASDNQPAPAVPVNV